VRYAAAVSSPARGVLTPEEAAEMAAAKAAKAAKAEAPAAAAAARDAEKRDAEKARIAKAEKQAARAGVLGASAEDGAIGATGSATIEATEYAKARPKRETAGKTSVAVAGFRDADGGTLELHPLRAFAANTRPGSDEPGAQPFRVVVRPAAQLVMDTHAHLCTNEVIGYLGGAWDAAARVVTVDKAFPGRGLASGSDVEMDPVAEVELKARVESEGMRVVGWYHSHPVFEPTPSGVDVDNQLNYQSLFAASLDSEEAEASSNQKRKTVSPFVGFIVGPYDLRLPTRVSKMTCFVAERRASGRGGAVEDAPFEVRYETTSDAPDAACVSAMCDVVTENATVAGRVRINELWRHFTNIANNKPDGGPCTKLAKLRASLAARLPDTVDELQEEKMLDAVAKHIQSAWNVDLGF
jgi:protein MYSM1